MKDIDALVSIHADQPPAALVLALRAEEAERWKVGSMEAAHARWLWSRRPWLAAPARDARTAWQLGALLALVDGFGALLFFGILAPVIWLGLLLTGCVALVRAYQCAARWESDYAATLRRVVRSAETNAKRGDLCC